MKQALYDQRANMTPLMKAFVNQKWENYETEFGAIFENFDLNEESKLNFTKSNISQMLKNLNDMHSGIKESFNAYSPQVLSSWSLYSG